MAQQVSVRHKSNVIARNRGDAAFTLIELLVVIVIVGIVSAVALLSFGILGDDRNLQREARRLGSLIELANDEATMQGRDYGMEIMQSGYRFLENMTRLTEQWQEIFGDETLRPRQLEEQMEFELFIEDRRVLLEEEAAETEEDEDDDDTNRNLDRRLHSARPDTVKRRHNAF